MYRTRVPGMNSRSDGDLVSESDLNYAILQVYNKFRTSRVSCDFGWSNNGNRLTMDVRTVERSFCEVIRREDLDPRLKWLLDSVRECDEDDDDNNRDCRFAYFVHYLAEMLRWCDGNKYLAPYRENEGEIPDEGTQDHPKIAHLKNVFNSSPDGSLDFLDCCVEMLPSSDNMGNYWYLPEDPKVYFTLVYHLLRDSVIHTLLFGDETDV